MIDIKKTVKTKYFVCDSFRRSLNYQFVKDFYKKELKNPRVKLHNTFKEAYKEMKAGFYDDSDYAVIKVLNNKIFTILDQNGLENKLYRK